MIANSPQLVCNSFTDPDLCSLIPDFDLKAYTGPPTVVIKILRDKRLFTGHTFVTQTTESPAILPFQPEQDGLLTEGLLKSCFLLFRNICIGHSRLYIENSNLNIHYRMQRVNCQVS